MAAHFDKEMVLLAARAASDDMTDNITLDQAGLNITFREENTRFRSLH
jgi:hypothetical protein